MNNNPKDNGDAANASAEPRKLTTLEQIFCGWPFVLVIVGGLIGGACGGAAWAINIQVMRGSLPAPVRYLLVGLTGLGAWVVYFIVILMLAMMFPDVFGQKP